MLSKWAGWWHMLLDKYNMQPCGTHLTQPWSYFLNGNFINKEGYNVRGMLQRKPESNTWAYKVNKNIDLGRKSEKQSLWATIKLYL